MSNYFTRILLFLAVWNTWAGSHQLIAQENRQATVPTALQQRPQAISTDKAALATITAAHLKREERFQVYVLFDTATQLKTSAKSILQVQDWLGNSWACVVFSQVPTAAQVQDLSILAWAEIQATDKINPYINDAFQESEKELEVMLLLDKDMTDEEISAFFLNQKLPLSKQQPWKDQPIRLVRLRPSQLLHLAASSYVRYINPSLVPQTMAYQAKGFTNTQPARQPLNLGGHNLNGSGVTIGIGDDSDPHHVDFDDRVTSFNPILASTHGFHTTGTVGGAGLKDQQIEGYAPGSQLVEDFFSQIIANAATYHQDFDMNITSNSYGVILHSCDYSGTYDLYSQFADQQMRDYPELLHVFAAANDGNMTCSPYPQGFATLTGSYSTCKNVLTVGSNGKTRDILSLFSSRGPTKDGRLKPEIIAVGTRLYSTVDNDNYEWNSGTSMACPNVAGAAGLLYQRYKQLSGGQDPQNALIKTLLMNGADDLGNPGPDFRYGFGLMNMGHSLRMLDSSRYFIDTINTGISREFTITVPPNTALAKIMLYWNDPAASPLAAHTLINNLDLQVITPNNTTLLPWVLNTTPALVNDNATAGVDLINNVEQITLNNPATGNYTLKVNGQNVPDIDQVFIVAYDFIPTGIQIQYPFGGEQIANADSMIIYWEASAGNQTFNIQFSANNGNSWQPVQNNIPADKRAHIWFLPPGISSSDCLIKIERNGNAGASTSKKFTMSSRPVITLAPEAEQCPGSIKINWASVAGATAYKVFKKSGPVMQEVATVNALNYTFSGLHTTEAYWVAVAPVINGSTGIRSIALSRMPNSGSCSNVVPGNLSVETIISPVSGRMLTSSVLGNNEPLIVRIQNQDDAPANHYRISYRLNNGNWQSQDFTTSIPAAGNLQVNAGSLDLANAGNYQLDVAITNLALTDPVKVNDSLSTSIYQLANPAIDLTGGYEEGFENVSLNESIGKSFMGLAGADRWDFSASKAKGRLRNFVHSDISIAGQQSMSLDNAGNQRDDIEGSSFNTLTGTFNLSNYTIASDELRCEFDYLLHGYPKFDTGNQVWLRGSDTDPWLPMFPYLIDTNNLGVINNTGSVSLSDLLTAAGQQFSSSTQIRLGQYDTSMISTAYFGNGLTFDNFNLYTVTDDAQLLPLETVFHYNCGLDDQVPLNLKVRNGVLHTIYDVAITYQLNGQPVVTAMIDSIPGKDTVDFTFPQLMDLSAIDTHNLSLWVYVATDTYRLNDSILNLRIINQPVIDSFPYLQNFEANGGYFFAEGNQSSWAYGAPSATKINHAASGNKAWKTNLEGTYNNRELSYLYSPCYDISSLDKPMLSFHLATDIEPPGTSVFDVAYVEYSHDGHTWQKLGAAGEGTNWYQNDSAQAWTQPDQTYWHAATIPLPKDAPVISFRFVLRTDQGAAYEGIALDDIHIYDLRYPVFDEMKFQEPIVHDLPAQQDIAYIEAERIGLAIKSPVTINEVSAQAYKHDQFVNADSSQYYLPKNFVVQSSSSLTDSITLRLYVPDAAMQMIRQDQTCPSCDQVMEVQQLGITQYADPDKSKENDQLGDNNDGVYTFIPKNNLTWVPYDIGYYTEVKVASYSEYWFNNGGPTGDQHLAADLFNFSAVHQGERAALLNWQSNLNTRMVRYHLQSADTSLQFTTIATVAAQGPDEQVYTYTDIPSLLQSPSIFYRIYFELENGNTGYSLIRMLDWEGSASNMIVYPNPITEGVVTIDWIKGNNAPLEWSLFNSIGQRINYGKIDAPFYSGKSKLNLGALAVAKGIYLLKINSGGEHWEFKLVLL